MTDNYPSYKSEKFQCPNCGVISQQRWFDQNTAIDASQQIAAHTFYEYRTKVDSYQTKTIEGYLSALNNGIKTNLKNYIPSNFAISTCTSCQNIALWVNQNLIHPKSSSIPEPNSDLDEDIQLLYKEAATIHNDSPKGATALLRLALQKLLIQIGKDGKNINNNIKELVENGLSPKIQQALDLLRVVGNNAVHPGQINLDDNNDVALKLFHVLNFITDEMISKPKELESLYNDIVPEETKRHINQSVNQHPILTPRQRRKMTPQIC